MAPISTTTEVARPPAEVFAYVTDPTRFVEWQQGVLSGHMDGDGPHRVGDICRTTRQIGGSERSVTSEITASYPGIRPTSFTFGFWRTFSATSRFSSSWFSISASEMLRV